MTSKPKFTREELEKLKLKYEIDTINEEDERGQGMEQES